MGRKLVVECGLCQASIFASVDRVVEPGWTRVDVVIVVMWSTDENKVQRRTLYLDVCPQCRLKFTGDVIALDVGRKILAEAAQTAASAEVAGQEVN